jgi:hypothetical protein
MRPSAIIDTPFQILRVHSCQKHLRETWPYDRFGLSSLVEGSVLRVGIIDEGSARAPPNMVESQARCQACAASIQRLNGVNVIPLKRISSEGG